MEGVISHLLSFHAPDHSSSHIWGLDVAPSASLQGLVTLIALVASAPMHPYCPNQLKGVGSDISVSSGEGSGWEVGAPDAASKEHIRAKGAAGAGWWAIPTSRVSECCTNWFLGTAGEEVKGKRSRYLHTTSAKIGWRHPLPPSFILQRQNGRNGHNCLPQKWGRGLCPCRGSLLRGLGNCVTQGRTRIKGCGSLVAPPFLPLSRLSASACIREAQVSPAPASRPTLQPGSPMDWRRDVPGKRGTYLSGRGRSAAHTQCNRLRLAACLALL